ncbi:hypothetical protein U9M48_012687 [Paspalum notatum var. saurae]|uniref:GRF-type domain-containing protein n=1 Tax=Paspalum notatum var. saurae TaxID=547442 RepID=A0AAQ3SYY5_PASNO
MGRRGEHYYMEAPPPVDRRRALRLLMAPKEDVAPQPLLQLIAQPQPQMPTCYCGIPIKSGLVMTPSPTQGHCFYTCGNWTPEFGATCPFFLWVA